jgi:hypothetical protein
LENSAAIKEMLVNLRLAKDQQSRAKMRYESLLLPILVIVILKNPHHSFVVHYGKHRASAATLENWQEGKMHHNSCCAVSDV